MNGIIIKKDRMIAMISSRTTTGHKTLPAFLLRINLQKTAHLQTNIMTLKKLLLSIFTLTIATTCFGQKISGLKLNNKQSILNDKAFFDFPANANNVARQADIMSADYNINKETRIILDIDEQRLVFFARELYVTSGDNLLETLSIEIDENAKIKILTKQDSLLSVLITPTNFDSTQNAILVNNLYVKTPDNTVFVIGAYINPDAFKNKDEFQQLSENIFASLMKGSRKLDVKARRSVSPIFDGKKKFSITLPEGYVITKDKKYDFEVLKIQKVRDISDTNWSSLTIYTGQHPSYFHSDYNFNISDAKMSNENFLDNPVEWLNFKNEERQFYLKEQKIPGDQIEDGMIVHIAMLGNNQEAINELTGIIESIKLTE